MTSENNRNTNSDLSSFLQDTSGRQRGEEAEKGKESPIWGKQFMLFWGPQKKNIIWSLQLVYGKRCRSQTSRSYKTGYQNCSWITCIQAASLHSGSVTALWPAVVTQLAAKPERWVRTVTFAERHLSYVLLVPRAAKETVFTTHTAQNSIQSIAGGKLYLLRF